MPTYILRVQLTEEILSNYKILKGKLIAIGFTKKITNDSGISYRLPNGNYLIKTEKDIDTVFTVVFNLVSKLDRHASIFIAESKNFAWGNLDTY